MAFKIYCPANDAIGVYLTKSNIIVLLIFGNLRFKTLPYYFCFVIILAIYLMHICTYFSFEIPLHINFYSLRFFLL